MVVSSGEQRLPSRSTQRGGVEPVEPQTASGVTFISMEDEHGMVNVIVHPGVAMRWRLPLLQARLLAVTGTWQLAEGVGHLVAQRLDDLGNLLPGLDARSRDFC